MKKLYPLFSACLIFLLLTTPLYISDAFLGSLFGAKKVGGQVKGAITDFIQDDVGLTQDEYFLGSQASKKLVPEVNVTFTQTDGKHHTAIATVFGLSNPQDAYYTWYLKNDDYDRTNRPAINGAALPGSRYMGELPADPDIQIERYKIAAMRAYIDAKFDSLRFDSEFVENGSGYGNGDGYLQTNEYPSEDDFDDEDGYTAYVGGDNNVTGGEDFGNDPGEKDVDNYCYVFDHTTGTDYELVQPEDGYDGIGGFECAGGGSTDVGGSEAQWAIGCMTQDIEDSQCPVIVPPLSGSATADGGEATTVTDTNTVTDPVTGVVTDTTTDTTNNAGGGTTVTVDQPAYPSSRALYNCDLDAGIPSCVREGGADTVICQGGGIPVCIPIRPRNDDGQRLVNEFETLFNERTDIASACYEPELPIATINELQTLLAAYEATYDAATDTYDSDAQNALDTAIGTYQGNSGVDLGTDSATGDYESIRGLFLDVGESLIDPNSFLCVGEFNGTVEPPAAYSNPSFAGLLGSTAPTCDLPSCVNFPDHEDAGDGGLYSGACGLETRCNEEIHLFPNSFGAADSGVGQGGFITGDGEFGEAEERFWGTNPQNASSVNEDLNDEMLIAGKGLMEFTWEYQEGDEIGVVVEGLAIGSTQHDNQIPMTSFAFMPEGCQDLITDSDTEVSAYLENIRTRDNVKFDIINIDHEQISDCLLDSFISPGNVRENPNLEVSLNVPSQSVVNNANFPIDLSVSITDEQATDEDYDAEDIALYNWKLDYLPASAISNNNPDDDSLVWEPYINHNQGLPSPEGVVSDVYKQRMKKLGINRLKGVGLKDLDLQANFYSSITENGGGATDVDGVPEEEYDYVPYADDFYIRITTEINAPTRTPGITRFGRDQQFIKVNTQGSPQLIISIVQASTISETGETVSIIGEQEEIGGNLNEICGTADGSGSIDYNRVDDVFCNTVKNEILAFEIPNSNVADVTREGDYPPEAVSWTLDGETVTCKTELSDQCNEKAIVFIPALTEGALHTVTATYVDPSKGLGAVEEFTRSFIIERPHIHIEPRDGLSSRDAGTLTNLINPTDTTNTITSSFVLTAADEFSAEAILEPRMLNAYIGGVSDTTEDEDQRVTLAWTAPGQEDAVTSAESGEKIETFAIPEYLVDTNVDIAVHAVVNTPKQIRNLLWRHFDVDQFKTSPSIAKARAEILPTTTPIPVSISDEEYTRYVQDIKSSKRGVFATAMSNTSSYILFILKLALTIGIILFVSSLMMPRYRK